MGIPTLWSHLYETAEYTHKDQLAIKAFAKRTGERTLRLGVDAPMWFAHANSIPHTGGANPVLRVLYDRLAHYFSHGISLLFVFDGHLKPSFKRNQHVGAGRVAFKRSFIQAVEAFGFQWLDAPGEAEAELAHLSRTDQIDYVLSDDIDTLLFGAKKMMRNPSKHLSGNEGMAKRKAAAEKGVEVVKLSQKAIEAQIVIYDSDKISEQLDLTRGGLILIGLMSGGDYDTGGLKGCGTVISIALAKAGFGDQLLSIYNERESDSTFRHAVHDWREELKTELRTNSRGYLPSKRKALADDIPLTFPNLALLASYADPATTKSHPQLAQDLDWQKEPCLGDIVDFLQQHLELTYNDIYKKLPLLYKGAFFYIARQKLLHPEDLPGLSKVRFEDLWESICSRRTSDNTGGLYEYRVNVDPARLWKKVKNCFEGPDENIGKAAMRKEEEAALQKQSQVEAGVEALDEEEKERQSRVVDPVASYREWIPAALVKLVAGDMKEEYERLVHEKEVEKAEALKRKEARARGEKVPRKSPVKNSPVKKRVAKQKTVEVESSPPEYAASKKRSSLEHTSPLVAWEEQDRLSRSASTSKQAIPSSSTVLSDSDLELLERPSPPKSPKKNRKQVLARKPAYTELSDDDDLPDLDLLPPLSQKPVNKTLTGKKVPLPRVVSKDKQPSPSTAQPMLTGFKSSKASKATVKPAAGAKKSAPPPNKVIIDLDSD